MERLAPWKYHATQTIEHNLQDHAVMPKMPMLHPANAKTAPLNAFVGFGPPLPPP